ncbi:MAG TPA: hypothetical protein VFB04_05205 [Terriglobales bacterium]|nr:hypothetical protein [Terriglobales bacterium]
MAIAYPLTLPSTPGFKRLTYSCEPLVGMSMGEFSGAQQSYDWGDKPMRVSAQLPPMTRAEAQDWIACLLAARNDSIMLPVPPGERSPRGSASGSPHTWKASVTTQTGRSISTRNWPLSTTVLKRGDWIQICRNQLVDPFSIDQSSWVTQQATKGAADAIVDPIGTSAAERVTPDGGATDAWVSQIFTPTRIAGVTFIGKVWLKAASGTPSINIYIVDQSFVAVASTACNLTTAWQQFSVTATPGSGVTSLRFSVGAGNSWVAADGAIDIWGAQVYSLQHDSFLHKVTYQDVTTDSGSVGIIEMFPAARKPIPEMSPIIYNNPVGQFRVVGPVNWDLSEAQHFGISFEAMEAY